MPRFRRRYRILDVFAGIGGLALGFDLMRTFDGDRVYELVCAVEMDGHACDTLRANIRRMGGNPNVVLQADLTDPETHKKIIRACGDGVDIIIGGPPCQSFSSIGARSASLDIREKFKNDLRDTLYLEYISLVRALNPAFLVMENVRGILTKKDPNGNPYIDLIVESIEKCGYRTDFPGHVRKYLELDAADYGVPQRRKRVFVIANHLGIENPIPHQTHSERGALPGTLPYVTLRDAIGDLPPLEAPITRQDISEDDYELLEEINICRNNGAESVPYHWDEFHAHQFSLERSGRQFLEFIRPARARTALTAHVARGQQLTDLELFARMSPGTTSKQIFYGDNPEMRDLAHLIKYDMESFYDKYRKQDWDSPCTTIFAHMRKDGNRFIHPDSHQARTFTVREAARVQSFSDDFIFTALGNVRYKYIGNAVPPLMARSVAEAIYAVLYRLQCEEQFRISTA